VYFSTCCGDLKPFLNFLRPDSLSAYINAASSNYLDISKTIY
jgi:hypothetical protein